MSHISDMQQQLEAIEQERAEKKRNLVRKGCGYLKVRIPEDQTQVATLILVETPNLGILAFPIDQVEEKINGE